MSPLITIRSRPRPETRFARIYVRSRRESHSILKALEKDGWELERQGEDTLVAGHRLVRDEPAARRRLHELGLLTSGMLHIEFVRITRLSKLLAGDAPRSRA